MENKNLDGLDPAQRLALARGEEVPQFTAVDMANADADGYRNGRASVVVELPNIDDPDCGARVSFHLGAYKTQCRQAIIAAGGSVKE